MAPPTRTNAEAAAEDPTAPVTREQFTTFVAQLRQYLNEERSSEITREDERTKERDRLNQERQKERDEKIDKDREYRKAHDIAKGIPHCDGLSQDNLRDWLREIDITVDQSAQTLVIAQQAARGPLRRELAHFISLHPDRTQATWQKARLHLSKVFLSPKEVDRLRVELHTIEQGAYEATPTYNMRFRELAEMAYPKKSSAEGQPIARAKEIEEIILDSYVAGLKDRTIAQLLLNIGQPTTYTDAIERVSEYDANDTKLDITRRQHSSRQEEPMDVSAVHQKSAQQTKERQVQHDDIAEVKRQISGMTSQFTKLMATIKQSTDSRPHHQSRLPDHRPQYTSHDQGRSHSNSSGNSYAYSQDGRPICNYCRKVGHVQRVCRSRLTASQNSSTSHVNQGGQ